MKIHGHLHELTFGPPRLGATTAGVQTPAVAFFSGTQAEFAGKMTPTFWDHDGPDGGNRRTQAFSPVLHSPSEYRSSM